MDFYLEEKKTPVNYFKIDSTAKQLLFIPSDESEAANETLALESLFSVTPPQPNPKAFFSRFESRLGLDSMIVCIPAFKKHDKVWTHIVIYRTQNKLVFVYEPHVSMEKTLRFVQTSDNETKCLSDIFYAFLDILTSSDSSFLQTMEGQIVALEDIIVEDPEKKTMSLKLVLCEKNFCLGSTTMTAYLNP